MLQVTLGANLYHHTFGRAFKVVALSDNDKEANRYMMGNPSVSVIDSHGGLVIMADKADEGRKL